MLMQWIEKQQNQSAVLLMPGIHAIFFSVSSVSIELPKNNGEDMAEDYCELIFCRSGKLSVIGEKGENQTLLPQEIALFLAGVPLQIEKLDGPFSGILVHICYKEVETTIQTLFSQDLPTEFRVENRRKQLWDNDRIQILSLDSWSCHVFSVLDAMSPREQCYYCAYKTLELFFMAFEEKQLGNQKTDIQSVDFYLADTLREVRDYMQNHLEEKLTISTLSNLFHISPTTLKSKFRLFYGMPIHRWLQAERMKRAEFLLQTSSSTVLEIAEAVGFSGVSQFNALFKQQFGVSPRQYRKNLLSEKDSLIP